MAVTPDVSNQSQICDTCSACRVIVPQSPFGRRHSLTEAFVRLAQSFESDILVSWKHRGGSGPGNANGKDVAALRELRTEQGAPIEVRATGPDARSAVRSLTNLIENRPGRRYWTVSREVRIVNLDGVHMHPAHDLVNTANKYSSQIILECATQVANCKSIMGILTLIAAHGSWVTIQAVGRDAGPAVDAISALIENKFGEG